MPAHGHTHASLMLLLQLLGAASAVAAAAAASAGAAQHHAPSTSAHQAAAAAAAPGGMAALRAGALPAGPRDPRSPSLLVRLRRFLQEASDKWDRKKDNRQTQATAYSSQGQDPGGPGDAFTYFFAEASASNYNGVYYNDNGKAVESGDMFKGGWSGTYAKNSAGLATPTGTTSAVASNFQPEYSTQRGRQAIAGTFCGARAVAGSSSMFNAQKKDTSVPWGLQAISANIDAYAPTPGERVSVRKKRPKDTDDINRGYSFRRSVAFTDIPPNSAAQVFTGNGPAAIATAWEVAASSRAARDKKPAPVTIGHREPGQNGVWDAFYAGGSGGSRRHRMILQCR